jgi:predicted phosphodiesterase
VPFYVFGHTHLAERLDAPPISYLNSGTWSERRPPGPAHGRTFVSVEHEGDTADARLCRWDDEAGRATDLA